MLVALIVVLGILVVYGVVLYNGIVSLRRQTQHAFGQIELQLKRRCDAIPALVEHVKDDLRSEQETLEKLKQARAQALSARTVIGKAAAENQLHRAIDGLFALAEVNPDLELDDELITIQEAFRSTQNKIKFAGQYYNDAATAYNLRLETFPSSLLSSVFHFTPIEPFELESQAARMPARV